MSEENTTPQDGAQATPPVQDAGKLSYEDLEAALAETRKEAAKYRVKAREAETQAEARVQQLAEQLEQVKTTVGEQKAGDFQRQIEELTTLYKQEAEARKQAEINTLKASLVTQAGYTGKQFAAVSNLLQGNSEEELRTHLEELATAFPPQTQGRTPRVGGGGGTTDVSRAEQLKRRIKQGNQVDVFDPSLHQNHGGGYE